MILVFELSMPNNNAWNGKWSGEGKLYAKVVNFKQKYGTSVAAKEKFNLILEEGSYFYSKEANRIRHKTEGFCGYGWMVDGILQNGKIMAG